MFSAAWRQAIPSSFPSEQELFDFIDRQLDYAHPCERPSLDKPTCLQRANGLAERSAADAEPRGESLFDHLLPGFYRACNDELLETRSHFINEYGRVGRCWTHT